MTYHRPGPRPTHPQRAKVPEVSTLPCPSGGLHRLVCDRWARVRCEGCGESWAALDEAVRQR